LTPTTIQTQAVASGATGSVVAVVHGTSITVTAFGQAPMTYTILPGHHKRVRSHHERRKGHGPVKNTICGCLCLLSGLSPLNAKAQFNPETIAPGARYLCNVPVRKTVQQLRKEVESKLGPIRCSLVPFGGPVSGTSNIDVNGKAFIKLDQRSGATESAIAHELLHLYLRTQGWTSPMTEVGEDCAHVYVFGAVLSEIEHVAMDQRAHSLGFDLDLDHHHQMKSLLARGGFDPSLEQLPQLVAITYAQMLRTDPEDARKLRPLAERQGLGPAVNVGIQLHSILHSTRIDRTNADRVEHRCEKVIWNRLPTYALSNQILCSLVKGVTHPSQSPQ
jgi:hypothetical protein